MKNKFISYTFTDNILYINIENNIIPNDKEFDECLQWFNEMFVNIIKNPFRMVINLEKLIMVHFSQIMKWICLFKKVNPIIEQKLIATAIICESDISEKMLNMFFAFYTPVRPTQIFKKNDDYSIFFNNEIFKN
jgi:hypothetical protein